MTFNITSVGDNPWLPGAYGYAYYPDQLIAGPMQLITQNIMVMSGGTLSRGTIMGRQTNFSILATPGTNTGNGTIGSITPGAGVETFGSASAGYILTATSPTVFSVTDPEGNSLGNATVGTAFTSPEINFTITAGGTAFVAGDSFVLTSQETVGNFIPCVKTASDGSQNPVCILADAVSGAAASTPQFVGAYFMGEFNINAVFMDTSWTSWDMQAALSARGIHLKSAVLAADPS